MKNRLGYFLLMAAGVTGFVAPAGADPLMQRAQQVFEPIPLSAPALPNNPATPAKVKLGSMLYFEPRLSKAHNVSCNTCHQIGLAGADSRPTSIGHEAQRGGRNAPTVFNAVFNIDQFWDGRAKDLEEQAGGPIINPIEMGMTETDAVAQLKGIPGYHDAFQQAFPSEADPINYANITKAIAVFEATLITPKAPFDQYLRGDANALASDQKAGLELFLDKGCGACHGGLNMGGRMYARFGAVKDPGVDLLPPADKGRYEVTHSAGDEFAFKVPSLRNIALTAPYFHTGRIWDLEQAVTVMAESQLGMQLSEDEVSKIAAFLMSLTGEQPQVTYPILPPSVATTRPPLP
ncbi:MAG: cytochrome-c peroxidase [Pseudomonadota bacterium]|nr:cytochrome-c peroxidase [Pseudomonadota bacterium]